jgi:hypothetical protein
MSRTVVKNQKYKQKSSEATKHLPSEKQENRVEFIMFDTAFSTSAT